MENQAGKKLTTWNDATGTWEETDTPWDSLSDLESAFETIEEMESAFETVDDLRAGRRLA